MARGPCTFKRSDLTRAVKAMRAAGCEVARVEVNKDGRIVVVTAKPTEMGEPTGQGANEWDGVS